MAEFAPTHRHRKRGTEYEVLGIGRLQVDLNYRLGDYDRLVIYRDAEGQLWARPPSEFNDGRFEGPTHG